MALYVGRMPRFSTIGLQEKINLDKAMRKPLSGYLGGVLNKSGYWTERLEAEWAETFEVKHAIACNSATSGLLATCMAAGIGPNREVWTTPLSMSATAACAVRLGADVRFMDIETIRYGIDPKKLPRGEPPFAIIVANIFGHPAKLKELRQWCHERGTILIEDAAQSPFAMEGKIYAGCVGHLGVFSLNVHKHMQCGEGGVVVTDDPTLAYRVRAAINHGELAQSIVGLNLRMTQPTAAIACAQLKKGLAIIRGRRALAHELTHIFRQVPGIVLPGDDIDCSHVYYVWAARMSPYQRRPFVQYLNQRGLPVREGYAPLLHQVFHSNDECLVAEDVQRELITFEVCAYSPTRRQLIKMQELVQRAVEETHEDRGTPNRRGEAAVYRGGNFRQPLRVASAGKGTYTSGEESGC